MNLRKSVRACRLRSLAVAHVSLASAVGRVQAGRWLARFGLTALMALLLSACGVPVNAPVLRPVQLVSSLKVAGPMWIEFREGDEIPIDLTFKSPLITMDKPPPVKVRVVKRFFMLVGAGPPRLSFDRERFIDRGGSFQFSMGNHAADGLGAAIVVEHRGGK